VVTTSAVSVGGTEDSVRIVSHAVGDVLLRRHPRSVRRCRGQLADHRDRARRRRWDQRGRALTILDFAFGSGQDGFVFVAPSFRSEPLDFGGTPYVSAGEPSPWDRDVDDALALLNAAIELRRPTRAGSASWASVEVRASGC
jgi:hypothetical protein